MKRSAKRKCVHCSELFLSDFRNRGRQRHCAKPECRKVARRSSQQRWLAKAENQNYFRGPENCARVREWRARHPGYWRKKKPAPHDALQESCRAQVPPDKETMTPEPSDALQELCVMQPAVLVGLISTISGCALQEEGTRQVKRQMAKVAAFILAQFAQQLAELGGGMVAQFGFLGGELWRLALGKGIG